MNPTALITALLAVLLLLHCGQERPSAPEQRRLGNSSVEAESTSAQAVATSADSVWAEQKLIRTAEISVEVTSVEEALEEIEAIASRQDALVADTNIEQYGAGNRRAVISVRVPTANFEAAVRDFRELGEVERENTTTEDVTKLYADLETRLSVKRETEQRLRELLSSRTGELAEVLQVERELGRLVGEIEQLEGERRYYDHRIAVSTIEIDLYETGAALRLDVLAPIGDALAASLSVLALSVGALIYVTAFVTPWLLVGIPIWLVAKKIRRRRSSEARGDEAEPV